MSALENVSFAVEHSKDKPSKVEALARANRYLEVVGLSKFMNKYPNTLSGGMRQRLAIARMFAMNPEMFLMDEPFGALDSLNRVFMQDLLTHLWSRDKERKTVLFVTHDVDEAILLSDKIAVMTPTPGRIKEVVEVSFPVPDEGRISSPVRSISSSAPNSWLVSAKRCKRTWQSKRTSLFPGASDS